MKAPKRIRTVFISGGTSGIGSALVRSFVSAGYDVSFQFQKNAAKARNLSERTGAKAYQLDFLGPWKPPNIKVDVLIHNAGINLAGEPFDTMSAAELNETMRVNVIAAQQLAMHFVPYMRRRKWGRIININSIYGFRAGRQRLSYNISKFGLTAVTQTLAIELAAHGITVNEICPGPVATAMLKRMATLAVAHRRYRDIETYAARCAEAVPVGRLIRASEVAAAAIFFSSELAAACTGISLPLDGGMGLRWP